MFAPPDRYSYSYLLGLYLGDGYVNIGRGGCAQLVIACDSRFTELIEDCWTAIQLAVPGCHVGRYEMPSEYVKVVGGSRIWPEAFPQHGPDRKHERPIVLEPWQREIADAFPWEFLGGDAYPRYFFSYLSADIRGLSASNCDRLGIRWTQSNHRNISVSHRHSVAAMDEFIGPKR